MDEQRIERENARNRLVEAVNARDTEALRDLVHEDGTPGDPDLFVRLRDIHTRWPRTLLTRGDIGTDPVAVVWMPDRNDKYTPVAHLELTVDDGSITDLALVDRIDPDIVAEEPASLQVAEWESATAMDSGEGPWI